MKGKRLPLVLLIILIIALPLLLIGIKQTLDGRSHAAAADKLEAESGTLSSSGVSKQSDNQASGGEYVLFQDQVPSPNPTTNKIYGVGFTHDGLNNNRVGAVDGGGNRKNAIRFKAEQSSPINNVIVYINGLYNDGRIDPGYAEGNGGIMRTTIQPIGSDGFPTNTILATATDISDIRYGTPRAGAGIPVVFPSSFTPVAGTRYAIVFSNVDPNPSANYFSIDSSWNGTPDPGHPLQPKYADADLMNLVYFPESGWTDDRGPGEGAITPIFNINYANGTSQGQGYMEVHGYNLPSGNVNWVNGTNMIREVFTSTNSMTIKQIFIRGARSNSGTSPLSLRLETSTGTQLVNVQIPASNFIIKQPANLSDYGQRWASVTLPSPLTIPAGSYNLVGYTSSGTSYWFTTARKGSGYGYSDSTYFKDGHAQKFNGSSWSNVMDSWGTIVPHDDFQFYFTLQ